VTHETRSRFAVAIIREFAIGILNLWLILAPSAAISASTSTMLKSFSMVVTLTSATCASSDSIVCL